MSWLSPSSWFLSAEDIAAGRAADEKLRALNEAAAQRGSISPLELERRNQAQQDSDAGTYAPGVNGSFRQGWQEGQQNVEDVIKDTTSAIANGVGSVIAAPAKGLASGMPWWLWLIALVALLVYVGMMPGVSASVLASARTLLKRK